MFSDRVQEMINEGISYPLASSSEKEKELVKMCSNENPYGPSPNVLKVLRQEIEKIGGYPESVAIELRKKIAGEVGIDPFQICLGNGSDEIMDLACKTFLNPGETVLLPTPTFSQYELSCRVNALEPKFLELEDYQWDADRIVDGMSDVQMIFLGRPNNPTGNSISEEGLERVLDTDKMVVVDEAYGEFSDYSVCDWVQDYDNLLVLRTFSKAYALAGLRVGYGVCNEELVKGLERVRPPFSVNHLAQKAAIAALEDKEYMEEAREKILKGRDYLEKELSDLGLKVLSSDANFLMVSPQPLGSNAQELCEYLAQNGILIRNLSSFRGVSEKWARITVGKTEHNKRLISYLKKYKKEIK